MSPHLKLLYPIVIGCTVLATLFSPWLQQAELPLFVMLMLTLGIPHGATDHLVYFFHRKQTRQQASFGQFLLFYLLAIVLYAVAWVLLPEASLWLFLLISAYHFGQAQFQHAVSSLASPLRYGLMFSWGLFVLAGMVLLHPAESQAILQHLIPDTYLLTLGFEHPWHALGGLGGLSLLCLAAAWLQGALTAKAFLAEVMNMALLTFFFFQSSLLISFGLFFACWHAVAAIASEIDAFRAGGKDFGWKRFAWEALPFSLISFVGIAMLLGVGLWLGTHISAYLLFFIAISTLTLPHMFHMHQLYALR